MSSSVALVSGDPWRMLIMGDSTLSMPEKVQAGWLDFLLLEVAIALHTCGINITCRLDYLQTRAVSSSTLNYFFLSPGVNGIGCRLAPLQRREEFRRRLRWIIYSTLPPQHICECFSLVFVTHMLDQGTTLNYFCASPPKLADCHVTH